MKEKLGEKCEVFAEYEYACVPVCKNVEYVGRTETFGIKLLASGGNKEF